VSKPKMNLFSDYMSPSNVSLMWFVAQNKTAVFQFVSFHKIWWWCFSFIWCLFLFQVQQLTMWYPSHVSCWSG